MFTEPIELPTICTYVFVYQKSKNCKLPKKNKKHSRVRTLYAIIQHIM